MAKAMLIQSKRKGNVLPEHLVKALSEEPSEAKPTTKKEAAPSDAPSNGLLPAFENKDDLVAYVVNKALDGDDEPINAISDKPTRGKAKAMMVKIKRGTVERPEMPVASQDPSSSKSEKNTVAKLASEEVSNDKESDDEVISRLIAAGLDGNMDEINALENRVLRGKIKAGIVKAKRAQN